MLAAKRRIRKTQDFRRIFRRGKIVRGPHLVVRSAPGTHSQDRFAFVVSTKVSKRATDRNLIKRRLRAAARSATRGAPPPLDLVVTALPGAQHQTFSELATELQQLLSSLHASPHRPTH